MSSNNNLTFSIPSSGGEDPLKIKLHQATDDDDDQGENETNTGFVMWPSAVMLAHHITKHESIILGDDTRPDGDIMELGAGCGLTVSKSFFCVVTYATAYVLRETFH